MWVITIVAVSVIGVSFGVSHYLNRHKAKSFIKDHAIGETVAITATLVWVILVFLMAGGIIGF